MTAYRVIVTGCRDWSDRDAVDHALLVARTECDIGQGFVIVHGACPTGADQFACEYGSRHGLLVEHHPANWEREGRSAGPRRNERMAAAGADLCLAFWDGESKGTGHMIKCAVAAGIPVRIIPMRGVNVPPDPEAFS